VGTIRTILFGMSIDPVAESKYVGGGWVLDEEAP
jgi:hypothetical protein